MTSAGGQIAWLQAAAADRGVVLARDLLKERAYRQGSRASLEYLQLRGRICELSAAGGAASLSVAARLLVQAQREGEPVAWIQARAQGAYPVDMERFGVDFGALAWLRLRSARDAGRAADKLLRSGGFGVVVLDLGPRARIEDGLQGRLLSLASEHEAAVLFLSEKRAEDPSMGPLVSLRLQLELERSAPGRFRLRMHALKDKLHGPGWSAEEEFDGPPGLC